MGTDFDSVPFRMVARSVWMNFDAGFMDFFVIRLAMPPYSLLAMYWAEYVDMGANYADQKLDEFYSLPIACMPFMCNRTRFQRPRRELNNQWGPRRCFERGRSMASSPWTT